MLYCYRTIETLVPYIGISDPVKNLVQYDINLIVSVWTVQETIVKPSECYLVVELGTGQCRLCLTVEKLCAR